VVSIFVIVNPLGNLGTMKWKLTDVEMARLDKLTEPPLAALDKSVYNTKTFFIMMPITMNLGPGPG
jgi:hypothetical protein